MPTPSFHIVTSHCPRRITCLSALALLALALPPARSWAQNTPQPVSPRRAQAPHAPPSDPLRAQAQDAPASEPSSTATQNLGVPGMAPLSLGQLIDPSITTASRILERATEAPATVYVVTAGDIRARGYSSLADVLKDLPGMETVEQYYSELGTLVPVRGVVGNNKIVLLINGMRVNPPGGEELMIRSDVDVRFADQIEVIYGPGSTLYGQDAISAVINIKTRLPGDATVEMMGGYGQYDTKEAYASFARTFFRNSDLPVSVTAYVAGRDADLSNFRRDFPQWWSKYDRYLAPINRDGPPVRGDLGLNTFVRLESRQTSLQAWYRESARSSSEGRGETGTSPVLYFVPEARWRDRSLVVEGQNALSFAETVTLHSTLTFNRYELDPQSRYVFPDGSGGLFLGDYKYAIGTSAALEEKLDLQLTPSFRLMVGGVATTYDVIPKTTVPGGADTRRDVVLQAGSLSYYTEAGNPESIVTLQRTVNLKYQQLGAYLEGAYNFNDNIRAIAGVRADRNTRFEVVPISPRAALIVQGLGGRLALKYIFSMAYVSPSPAFAWNVYDNGGLIGKDNPNLNPERARSNEANISWRTEYLLLSGSAYYNEQSDLLIISQSGAPETVVSPMVFVNADGTGPRRLAQSVNLGSSKAMGFDAFFRFSTSRVSGWGSYSYVDFKRTLGSAVSGLPQISRHNVRVGTTLAIFKSLSVTPSLVLRSTPENLPDSYRGAGVSLRMPWEINVSALFTPVEPLDLMVTVRNASFRHYALRGIAGPALQEPGSVMGGLRVRY
jgi:outer membrane receptor protein involved in Fe transport